MSEPRPLDIRRLMPYLLIIGLILVVLGLVLFGVASPPWSAYGIWLLVIGIACLVGSVAGWREKTLRG